MKKIISIFSFLFAISFATAADLGEVLGTVDQSLVILIALFLVSFSIAFFSLNKVFKDNKTMTGVVSGTLAFLVIYGVNKINFDTQNFFSEMGISESAFSLMLFILISVGIVYMSTKLKKDTMLVIGTLLLALSFFVYSKALLMTLGLILLIIWFFVRYNKNNNKSNKDAGAGI